MIKKAIKILLPRRIISYLINIRKKNSMKKSYHYDLNRYLFHSRTLDNGTAEKLAGQITTLYHIIEKGLTMPETRLGFGVEKILLLCDSCISFISLYGRGEEQVENAIQVILEYENLHLEKGYKLDASISNKLVQLKNIIVEVQHCSQRTTTKEEYFKNINDAFLNFSESRASVRNFSVEDLSIEKINEALNLARNTPSACNRQSWRTYVFANKAQINKILEIQGGNRGFGHLTNKLIVIAGEISVFSGKSERNQVFIDGGIYAMNLLYALHYNKIAACILNCSHSPEKDLRLRELCRIRESEVFIAMVACGIPPKTFKIANSKRYSLNKTNVLLN